MRPFTVLVLALLSFVSALPVNGFAGDGVPQIFPEARSLSRTQKFKDRGEVSMITAISEVSRTDPDFDGIAEALAVVSAMDRAEQRAAQPKRPAHVPVVPTLRPSGERHLKELTLDYQDTIEVSRAATHIRDRMSGKILMSDEFECQLDRKVTDSYAMYIGQRFDRSICLGLGFGDNGMPISNTGEKVLSDIGILSTSDDLGSVDSEASLAN